MKDTAKPISRKTGRLIAKNLIILLVLIVVCVLFIWAWFTKSQKADADGINIKSYADGVQVSWDGENWYNDLTALTDAEIQTGLVGPAMNISGEEGEPEALTLITGNGLKFYEPLLNRKTGAVLENADGSWNGYDIAPSDSTGKYVDIDLYFRSEMPKDVYLAGDSLVSPKDISQRISDYGSFSKDYIAAASRIAFLNADKTDCSFIWAPNSNIELADSDATYEKFDIYQSNNYPVPTNASCVLVNPDTGIAITSANDSYKKAVIFTDNTNEKISPVSITASERFMTELVEDESSSGTEDSSEVEQPEEQIINLWNGTVGLGDWSGYVQLDSSTMSAVQEGDFIRLTVKDAQDDAQVTIQNSSWGDIDIFGFPSVSSSQTTAEFEVTSDVLSTVRNGIIAKGKWATLISVDIIRNKNAGGASSDSLRGTAVANSATLEIEDATSKTSISTSPSSTLKGLASGGEYYYIGSNGYAYVPFYVEESGYYSLNVITASNSSAKDLRVIVNIDESKGGSFVNEIISSPQTSNKSWKTVSVTDSMLLQANTQYYVAAVTDDETDDYISVDAFEIEWQSSAPDGPSETFTSSTYKFKNLRLNRYLDISNGTVTYNTTGSNFKLCHFDGHAGPVLQSGDYYLVIQNGNITVVEESELNLNEAITVYTGGSYLLNTDAFEDTQPYTYYDSDEGSVMTLGADSSPKLFTSTTVDPETMLIGNTKIITLEKENETDEYYTAHIVMRIWAEGTDREAKTPLADGIFEASLHFVTE